MTALNKQALIAKIKKQTESFDTVVLKEDEANALLDELETKEEQRANWFQMAQKLGEDLDAAEKRIAELSASHSKLRDTMATIHNTIRIDGGYTPLAAILNAAKRAHEESATAAGIGVKGE